VRGVSPCAATQLYIDDSFGLSNQRPAAED
jgi:hypothetical protein